MYIIICIISHHLTSIAYFSLIQKVYAMDIYVVGFIETQFVLKTSKKGILSTTITEFIMVLREGFKELRKKLVYIAVPELYKTKSRIFRFLYFFIFFVCVLP